MRERNRLIGEILREWNQKRLRTGFEGEELG
jgi:hypothetical protein